MISKHGRQWVARPIGLLVGWLHNTGVTPNMLTVAGFALTVVSAVFLGGGYLRLGGLVLLSAVIFDMLDGSLARATDQSSTFGAFFDSTLDRYSESITFLGSVYYYSTIPGSRTELALIFAILVGSMMVSYTRARAEALQVECNVGIMQRPERVVLLILGLLSGWMLVTLWILAVFTDLTAFQRIYEVYWRTRDGRSTLTGQKMVNSSDNPTVQG